ncbi:alpha/beta fold hydrolase [Candidatus Mycolicibacterium alkanivorans]|uniref:Alpha/beta fold hydrolase n=1 Tax=Candidatus Mycolicibacterium alkanivorans TaxID=2954114 RepID=A0ABS9YYE1_9MYCO|nr:alpha/beta fold hydrolase [Candidatus Mycolicibacterium alkanivorans]MCI4676270.1 alpha/beta fold hydrolase [Candidatus Mycolicibacterium alkanivorans]
MAFTLRGVTTVLLPGTGSDDDYVYRAFAGPLHEAGAVVVAIAPQPANLVAGYLQALEDASRDGAIAVGGVSIGAAVAAAWALALPGRAVAVLAALPPWTGEPYSAPAALAARRTAAQLRTEGLAATMAQMRASSPVWLADELARSWLRQWPELPDALEEAAGYVSPSSAELERLSVPMGIVAASDDPIHPVEVALEWMSAAPRAALSTVTLDEFGPEPAVLGAACLAALQEAAG